MGRAPGDKVPFPEVVLPSIVEGVAFPDFSGPVSGGWVSTFLDIPPPHWWEGGKTQAPGQLVAVVLYRMPLVPRSILAADPQMRGRVFAWLRPRRLRMRPEILGL